jgi:signal peptidase I
MDAPLVPPSAVPAPPAPADSGSNIKETLESILVAFILAFIFRCFVVEAFVIPTGSMAPTLLGANSRFDCPDCGYHFEVNYSSPKQSDDDVDIPDRVQPVEEREQGVIKPVKVIYDDIHCPNCGLRLPQQANPPVWYGDRILVLKYLYLLQEPQRWDVVVFKSPSEKEKDYSINFIKRLIGKPGDTIMVLDGDIYIKTKGSDHFEISRKTRAAQEAMWRILYDNDHHPIGSVPRATAWQQPWTPSGTAWSDELSHGRAFTFNAPNGAGMLSFNGDANRPDNKSFAFSDWLAYDQRHSLRNYFAYRLHAPWNGEYPVSDLKLDLYYSRSSGEGPLKLKLTKLDHAFTAEVTPGGVRLRHEVNGNAAAPDRTASLPSGNQKPLHLEFMNVDYRVTLRVDGKDVLETTHEDYHPDIPDLQRRQMEYNHFSSYPTRSADGGNGGQSKQPLPLPTVSIAAEHQVCKVEHLSLWRDVYYTPKLAGNAMQHWAGPEEMAGGEGGPITLGDNEYFVMGDNSPMSYDARFWTRPVELPDEELHAESGRVPDRFLLGRAFFVYWPAGFRPMDGAPGLIPNFGQMRFIR